MTDLFFKDEDFDKAVSALKAGKVAIFPTDTVFGLGVSVFHAKTPEAIFSLKGRNHKKPVAWLVQDTNALDLYGKEVPQVAYDLAETQWPGPLTLVVKASSSVPLAFQSEKGTIGLRVPDSPLVQALLDAIGCPLATSSANLSGSSAVLRSADLPVQLTEKVAATLQEQSPLSGTPSTVIDCSQGELYLLRP